MRLLITDKPTRLWVGNVAWERLSSSVINSSGHLAVNLPEYFSSSVPGIIARALLERCSSLGGSGHILASLSPGFLPPDQGGWVTPPHPPPRALTGALSSCLVGLVAWLASQLPALRVHCPGFVLESGRGWGELLSDVNKMCFMSPHACILSGCWSSVPGCGLSASVALSDRTLALCVDGEFSTHSRSSYSWCLLLEPVLSRRES